MLLCNPQRTVQYSYGAAINRVPPDPHLTTAKSGRETALERDRDRLGFRNCPRRNLRSYDSSSCLTCSNTMLLLPVSLIPKGKFDINCVHIKSVEDKHGNRTFRRFVLPADRLDDFIAGEEERGATKFVVKKTSPPRKPGVSLFRGWLSHHGTAAPQWSLLVTLVCSPGASGDCHRQNCGVQETATLCLWARGLHH